MNSIESRVVTKDPSRRRFLKYGIIGGLGAAYTAFAFKEKEHLLKDLANEHATFYPLYENHLVGISEAEIREDLDICFFEGYQRYQGVFEGKEQDDAIGTEHLYKLLFQGTKIMNGDINYSLPMLAYHSVLEAGGMKLVWDNFNKPQTDVSLPRRELFRKVKLGLGVWMSTSILASLLPSPSTFTRDSDFKRASARLVVPLEYIHPEDIIIHLRNAVMADKILEAAKTYSEEEGKKVKIAYNVGIAHSGMEDFIRAGQDFCRDYIFAHPKALLNLMVNMNTDETNFSSASIYDFSSSPNEERKIIDRELERRLKQRSSRRV